MRVNLLEYGMLRCPYCGRLHADSGPERHICQQPISVGQVVGSPGQQKVNGKRISITEPALERARSIAQDNEQ